jgi:hypothetical protein
VSAYLLSVFQVKWSVAMRAFVFAALLGVVTSVPAPVLAITFDFEGATATSGWIVVPQPPPSTGSDLILNSPGALTSLTQTQSGVTMTLGRGGTEFDVVQPHFIFTTAGLWPSSFGNRSLDPFHDKSPAPFLASFSQSLTSVSIEFGDSGEDADQFFIKAYSGADGTGLIRTELVAYTGAFPFTQTLTLTSALPFLSIEFMGGFAGCFRTCNPLVPPDNSLFYDNITVTPSGSVPAVPIPPAVALFGTGLGLMGLLGWRRKKHAA